MRGGGADSVFLLKSAEAALDATSDSPLSYL